MAINARVSEIVSHGDSVIETYLDGRGPALVVLPSRSHRTSIQRESSWKTSVAFSWANKDYVFANLTNFHFVEQGIR